MYSRYDLTLLELEIAKEILQEVFGIEAEDVGGIIEQRLVGWQIKAFFEPPAICIHNDYMGSLPRIKSCSRLVSVVVCPLRERLV